MKGNNNNIIIIIIIKVIINGKGKMICKEVHVHVHDVLNDS